MNYCNFFWLNLIDKKQEIKRMGFFIPMLTIGYWILDKLCMILND
jgi:hypothetical protein